MSPELRRVLEAAFPGEDARYFSPMLIGDTPAVADAGATAILAGAKTATSPRTGITQNPDHLRVDRRGAAALTGRR